MESSSNIRHTLKTQLWWWRWWRQSQEVSYPFERLVALRARLLDAVSVPLTSCKHTLNIIKTHSITHTLNAIKTVIKTHTLGHLHWLCVVWFFDLAISDHCLIKQQMKELNEICDTSALQNISCSHTLNWFNVYIIESLGALASC